MSRQTSDMPEVPERPGNRKRKRDRPWSLYVIWNGLTRTKAGLLRRSLHGRYETQEKAQAVADKMRREIWFVNTQVEIVKEG